ncbi:MAG: M24 family metallopeptidase [Chloroflexota bacterium]|nr:M24 family metallopeptidase [Dehalococcoidia bacterium]MDW8255246.1 M24 family metallopeptidase [Chloroflexota bacterium]
MDIERLRAIVAESGCSAWLLTDFRRSNRIAYRALGLDERGIATRRWYYLLPKEGPPRKLVSAVEPGVLDRLPGDKHVYRTWQEREAGLALLLAGHTRVAAEYSPHGQNPAVGAVDAGTIELIRSLGVEVVSSADLVQRAVAVWSEEQIAQHREASRRLLAIKDRAFAALREAVRAGQPITDWQLQQQIMAWINAAGMVTDHAPEVATDGHASDPHFSPAADRQTPIAPGSVVLLDVWAKLDEPGAVYADYTWMAYVGESVPERPAALFAIVAAARDAAIDAVRRAVQEGRPLRGYEVDRVAREVVTRAGYGDAFVHRTGHNIGQDVHGEGANIDDYETHDERVLLPNTCFSIEPGIYLPDIGVRSEVNVLLLPASVEVTGEIQQAIVPLLAG